MGRPRKKRRVVGVPRPVIFIPSGWTSRKAQPVEVAIEDFEVMRLVDGHAYGIEEAALKVGVGKSTAGRMLERARRLIALGIEQRAPVYLDAVDSTVLRPPEVNGENLRAAWNEPDARILAVAVNQVGREFEVSRIFGRTTLIALVRPDAEVEFLENPGFAGQRGAAGRAVSLLTEHNVGRIVAGRFGPDALQELGKAGIEPVIAIGISFEQAAELFCIQKITI